MSIDNTSLDGFLTLFKENMVQKVSQNYYNYEDKDLLKEMVMSETLKVCSPLIRRKLDEQRKFLSHVRLAGKGENTMPHTQDAKEGAYLFREMSVITDEMFPDEIKTNKSKKRMSPFDRYREYVDTWDIIPPDAHMEMAMGTVSASSYSKYRQTFKEEGYVFETIPMKWDKSLNRWWRVVERPKAKKNEMIEDIGGMLEEEEEDTVAAIRDLLKESSKNRSQRINSK